MSSRAFHIEVSPKLDTPTASSTLLVQKRGSDRELQRELEEMNDDRIANVGYRAIGTSSGNMDNEIAWVN